MIYSVEAFDKEDESLAFEIALPEGCETQLAKIMNWTSPQRGDEGYNLNDAQLSNIEALTNKCTLQICRTEPPSVRGQMP